MRFTAFLTVFCLIAVAFGATANAQTEDEIVQQYLSKYEEKHTQKLGWASLNFGLNRIDRHNDYNDFAILESSSIDGGELSWIKQGYSIGGEFGLVFSEKFTWSLGGEYWLKMGETLEGSYSYTPPGGTPTTLTDPSSEVQVYGFFTGVGYYVLNPPTVNEQLTDLALQVNGTVGYYSAQWDLWSNFQNFNLATSQPEANNTTYQGTAPGFSLGMKADYPLNFGGLALGVDMHYLFLNFTNVAWYNSADQEIVVSVDQSEDGRVDLDFSGFRGKLEVKRFFSF